MNRSDKIEWLVNRYVWLDADDGLLFTSILRTGHKGFDNMTDEELDAEMEENGYEEDEE